MSSRAKDVYGGNYSKSKQLAIRRSSGNCQFCGLRKAEEGHHWAWPDYPSGEEVQGHDITALCKTCHELATVLRDWVGRKNADFDQIAEKIKASKNFYEKREAFSYWLFPEEKEEKTKVYNPPRITPAAKATEVAHSRTSSREAYNDSPDTVESLQMEIEMEKELRKDLEKQIERLNRTESSQSHEPWKNTEAVKWATGVASNAGQRKLEAEYKESGRRMGYLIRKQKALRKEGEKFDFCSFFFAICGIGFFILIALAFLSS